MNYQAVFQLCDKLERLSTNAKVNSKSTDDLSSPSPSADEPRMPLTSPLVRKHTRSSDCYEIQTNDPSVPNYSPTSLAQTPDPPWATAPAELLLRVFEMLDPLSIVNAADTCKRWRSIIADTQSLQWRKMKEYNLELDVDGEEEELDVEEIDSMSIDADSDDESDMAVPTRFQRLACIQRWIEGSWSSIRDGSEVDQNYDNGQTNDNGILGRRPEATGSTESRNWLTAFSFQHSSPLTTQEWGKVLDSQFCQC